MNTATYITDRDCGDESDTPPPPKVCLMCRGNSRFFYTPHPLLPAMEVPCPSCMPKGRVLA